MYSIALLQSIIYNHCLEYSNFVDFKNNGGLVSSSECAFKIIYQAETFLLILTNNLQKYWFKNNNPL